MEVTGWSCGLATAAILSLMSGVLFALTRRLKAKRDLDGTRDVGVCDRTAVGREAAAEVKEVLPWPPQPGTKR